MKGFKGLVEELFRHCTSFILITRNLLCFNFNLELSENDRYFRLNEIFNEIVLIKRNFSENYALYKQILNNSREFKLIKSQ